MRTFEIFDTSKRSHPVCATLLYEEETGIAKIELNPETNPSDMPFLFGMFAERGDLTIGPKWAMRWISDRIPPQGRQNIGEILRAHNMVEYDEIELLSATKGQSSHDDFQVRECFSAESSCTEYAVAALEEQSKNCNEETNDGSTELHKLQADIGRRLALQRKEAGLTQRQLAQKTGIDQAVISRIERGRGNPTIETLYILAKGMGNHLTVEIR